MTRFITSLIAAVIIQILFYRYVLPIETAPPWAVHWNFKVLLFIVLVYTIRAIWNSVAGTQAQIVDRAKATDKMKLDQDVRRAILDRAELAGNHLAESIGKLESINRVDLAEKAIKARAVLSNFAQSLNSQLTGPGPESGGYDFGDKTADRIVRHDKDILAIVEEISDDAADLASNADSENAELDGSVEQIAEAARRLQEQINMRDEILKGIR